MRLLKWSLRGFNTFPNTVEVNLEELGPGLVALVGPNGAGKTTLMEAALASVYRQFVTKPGGLYPYAIGNDAFIESTWRNGSAVYTARVNVDATRRSTEAQLIRDGATIAKGPAECNKVANKIFGPLRLATSTIFADQKKTKWFLRQTAGARKQVLSEMLSLAYLQEINTAVSGRLSRVETDLASARADIQSAEARAADLADLEIQLDALRTAAAEIDVAAARESERLAIVALEQARGATAELERLKESLAGRIRERDSIEGQVTTTGQNRDALILSAKARKAPFEAVLKQTPESIKESYADRRRQTEARITGWKATIAEGPKIKAAAEQVEAYRKEYAELQKAEKAWKELQLEATRADGALRTANAAYEGACAQIRSTRAGWQQQADQVDLVPCSIDDAWIPVAQTVSLRSSDSDRAGMRYGTGSGSDPVESSAVTSGGTGVQLWQTCPLLAIAREAKKSLEQPAPEPEKEKRAKTAAGSRFQEIAGRLQTEKPKADARGARMQELERLGHEAAQLAGRAPEIEQARNFLSEDTQALESLDFERDLAIEALANDQETARTQIKAIEAEILSIRSDAETKIDGLRTQLESAKQRVAAALSEVNDRSETLLPVRDAEDLLREARLYREQVEQQERDTSRSITELETKIAALAPVDARGLELLKDHAQDLERQIARLNLLADATGKNGVPTLRIDEALPRIGETTNQLLNAGYGPRYSIKLSTLREKVKAGEYSEELDVLVYDNGQERLVEAICGGEEVFSSEALSLGLAIFNRKSAGNRAGAVNAGIWEGDSASATDYETLFRDETAGALSPENAQAYIKMLRAAMQLGGYSNIIFVSHSPEVWHLADVRLRIEDGAVNPV